MLCCVVAGSVMALVFRLRMWLTRRRPGSRNEFAPPARRSALGEVLPTRIPSPPPAARGRGYRTACAGAIGVLAYLALTGGLLRTGLAHAVATNTTWTVRTLGWVGAAAVLCVLAWRQARGRRRSSVGIREHLGCGLVGIGLAWFVLGVADMHLFGVFALGPLPAHAGHHGAVLAHHASTWRDVVFHSGGAALAIAGWLTLPVRPFGDSVEKDYLAAQFAPTRWAHAQGSAL